MNIWWISSNWYYHISYVIILATCFLTMFNDHFITNFAKIVFVMCYEFRRIRKIGLIFLMPIFIAHFYLIYYFDIKLLCMFYFYYLLLQYQKILIQMAVNFLLSFTHLFLLDVLRSKLFALLDNILYLFIFNFKMSNYSC